MDVVAKSVLMFVTADAATVSSSTATATATNNDCSCRCCDDSFGCSSVFVVVVAIFGFVVVATTARRRTGDKERVFCASVPAKVDVVVACFLDSFVDL